MANMQEIRSRINSVKDTMKITNAMYLISSAKLRKARNDHDAVSPYFDTLQRTIADILARDPDLGGEGLFEDTAARIEGKEDVSKCYIIIASDKGLAGAYNHNVFKLAEEKFSEKKGQNELILVGHMGINYFKNMEDVTVDEDNIYPAADPVVYRAQEIADQVIERFLDGRYDEVHVVYTKMINSMAFEPRTFKVLPLDRGMFDDVPENETALQEPEYSPSPAELLQHIVPNYVKGLIYGAMVESYACEQSARMTAMDNATTNAKDMIAELSLIYNRVRQAQITQEITEIVSGAQSAH